MFSILHKDRSPFTKVIYAPCIQWDQFTSTQYHLNAISEKRVGLKTLIRTRNKAKREEWNLYIIKRSVNLSAEYLKEKTKDLQITVSTSREPHIINKLINILITVRNAERSINKRNEKSRIPNTQNSLTLKQKINRRGKNRTKKP